MGFLYQRRQSVAGLATATILGVLLAAMNWRVELVPDTKPVEMTIETMPEPVPPTPAAPPAPQEPPPVKSKDPSFEKPKPRPQKPRPPLPVQAVKTAPVQAQAKAPAPAKPAAPTNPAANIQNEYAAALRAYLHSIRRYPNTKEARMLHPQGTVALWFLLDRGGALLDAGIEQSGGSPILDRAALATVRGGAYPPFPNDAFPGESSRRFTVNLDYRIE